LTYRHKKKECAKSTKDILENVIKEKDSEYEIVSSAKVIKRKKKDSKESKESEDEESDNSNSTNTLSNGDTVNIQGKELEAVNRSNGVNYELTGSDEVDFNIDEAKKSFEKKKRLRNYLEFRADYAEL
jgi:hypothetical protein